ncbi:unnamed protein product [Phytophthora fragariaefolia]|uniref:Unnamed protein product n=1 Tax=Phytophthora fragariaefolia TaxID=1490495 RepID=A0A9W6XZQ4_9STRA|nr:unnamed protein product [Phytophthora fragariaefolia]
MSKHRNPPDGDMAAQLAEVASFSRPISYLPIKSPDGCQKHFSPKTRQKVISHAARRTMTAASTSAASGTPFGAGSTAPSASFELPPHNNGRGSSNESEEEEAEWQPSESKTGSPDPEAQDSAPTPQPQSTASAPAIQPSNASVGGPKGLQP